MDESRTGLKDPLSWLCEEPLEAQRNEQRQSGVTAMHPFRFFTILALSSILLAGCASNSSGSAEPSTGGVLPQVVQQQGNGPWVTLPIGTGHTVGLGQSIAPGSDGAMWVCDNGFIDRIDMRGNVQYFSVPGCGGLIPIPDNRLFFSAGETAIAIVDRSGQIS